MKRVLPLAVVVAMVLPTDAYAATVNVSETNFKFTPVVAKLRLGDTVLWTNNSTSNHTATGDGPLFLWDSLNMVPGATFSFQFTAAGIYTYNCVYHSFQGMTGSVGAKDRVTPPQGSVGTQFTVMVATIPAATGYVYDIQKKDPAGSFQDWMTNITTATVIWDSTGQPTGVYQFRSRLRRVSDGAASQYSPGQKVTLNP